MSNITSRLPFSPRQSFDSEDHDISEILPPTRHFLSSSLINEQRKNRYSSTSNTSCDLNSSHKTYTVSRLSNPNDGFDNSYEDANSSKQTYTLSPRQDVMSTTYDIEKSNMKDIYGRDSYGYDQLSRSRTSSSETFTKASDSPVDYTFDEQFPENGPTSLSSDDISVSDQASTERYRTFSRIKPHHSSRNIPLSFSSSLSTATYGSEASLNSGLRMNTERLTSAIGLNGSQTISRGKLQPASARSTNAIPSATSASAAAAASRSIQAKASNLMKPKTFGSRMRFPTSSSSSSHSQASISQSSSQVSFFSSFLSLFFFCLFIYCSRFSFLPSLSSLSSSSLYPSNWLCKLITIMLYYSFYLYFLMPGCLCVSCCCCLLKNDLNEEYLINENCKPGIPQKTLPRNGTFRVPNSQAYKPVVSNVFKQPTPPSQSAMDSVNNNCKSRIALSKSGFGFPQR